MIETRQNSSTQAPGARKTFRFDAGDGNVHAYENRRHGMARLVICRGRNSDLHEYFRFFKRASIAIRFTQGE
jgi:hypothetical protein